MPNYSHGTKLSLASAEEPPYLNVGTDVSAKYKGAFCEAKIIDVNKHVKLRVLFDGSSGSYLIDDADLKAGATLETGSKIEAKHPEKKQQTYVQATITKILDHSRYTVVFDDGDQCVLRRNSLCLKSGKHFAESETLDQLPLTNPEHFGNPVKVGAYEQQQQQQQNNHQQVSNNQKNSNNNSNTSSDNNHNSNSGQVSSITSNRLQNNIKHETEKQARGKPATPASGASGRRGVKGRKRRESVNNGSKHAQEPDNDSIDSCPDSAEADTSESNVRYDLIEIGVKLMVQYGKGKVQNVYEAKVNKIETTPAGKTRYFVHYTGWNNRYDEWVTKNRIVSIVTEKENGTKDGRSKQTESNSANSNSSAPSSASTKDANHNRERDKEKDKDKDKEKEKEKEKDVSSSKTRRSRQSEAVSSNNAALVSTTASITTSTTTTVQTIASTAVATSSATTASASSSQSPESQQFSQSPITTNKSETTASRPAATTARQHRQRGDNSAAAVSTTTATTVTTTLLASTSPTTTTTTTTATTASALTTSTTASNNNATKSSQRNSQQTIPSQEIEVQEQTTIGRHSSGRRARALADRVGREGSGEKQTNTVGRRGGNNATPRSTSRASTATIGQPEASNIAGQLSGRRIKCPDCGAGRCRCRGRRQLLSPSTATPSTRESPSPPQQQMSSTSQKPSSPVSSSASTALANGRNEVTPSSAHVEPKVESAPSPPNSTPSNNRALTNQSLVPPKAEPSSNASNPSSDDQSSADSTREPHVTLSTTATSTRDGQSTMGVSVSHSTSGLSSVTTAVETSVISDGITTRDCSSNSDSIGGGSTSSSSASSRSEISERRGSTSTATSNNVESISATSASNISASSSTRRLYSFCEEIEEPDCDKKISILQERIMALRQTYKSLKTELADLDRRRKRPRTERSNSEHITCGVTCRS